MEDERTHSVPLAFEERQCLWLSKNCRLPSMLESSADADALIADALIGDTLIADALIADAHIDALIADALIADAYNADAYNADAYNADAYNADAYTTPKRKSLWQDIPQPIPPIIKRLSNMQQMNFNDNKEEMGSSIAQRAPVSPVSSVASHVWNPTTECTPVRGTGSPSTPIDVRYSTSREGGRLLSFAEQRPKCARRLFQ